MATYDEIMAGSPAAAPSLAGMYEDIAQKPLTLLEQKKQRLGLDTPKPEEPAEMSSLEAMRSLQGGSPGGISEYDNLLGSSLLKSAGTTGDTLKSASNSIIAHISI